MDQTKKASTSPWAVAYRQFVRNKLAVVCLIFLLLVTVLCLCASLLSSYDPIKINIRSLNQSPSSEHFLGTDKGGRDILGRLLYGGQTTLKIGFSITLFVTLMGALIGAISGYFGGKIDAFLMRFTDFVLTFPYIMLVIALKGIFPASGVGVLIVVISFLSWGSTARMVRSKILAEKQNDYVLAAVSIGCKSHKVILKHLLPNVISTIIVQAVYILATMIAVETSLSFLGFGVPSNVPSWGNMMSDAISPEVIRGQWWVWLPAGTLIILTILAINFIGDGAKQAFDPKK